MTAGGFPHSEILGSKPCWRLPEAYRSLTRPSSVLSAKASTIRPSRASKHRTTDLRTNDHKTIRTKNKTSTRRSSSEKTVNKKRIFLARVHSPVLKPPPRPEPEPANPTRGTDGTRYGEPRQTRRPGGGPGTQKHAHTTREPPISSTPAAPPTPDHPAGGRHRARTAP